MKGIAHFALGVCGTSFVGAAVESAAQGDTLPFALAGVAAMLPDVIDFRVVRYLVRPELRIAPDPLEPNIEAMADALGCVAVKVARSGIPVTVELEPMRLSGDAWQSYEVRFGGDRTLSVSTGDVVDTGGRHLAASEPRVAERVPGCRFAPDYTARLRVDRLSGLTFRLTRRRDGAVVPVFLPWHRNGSHSFVVAGLLAAGAAWAFGWLTGVSVAIGFGLHVLADQLGVSVGGLFRAAVIPGLVLTGAYAAYVAALAIARPAAVPSLSAESLAISASRSESTIACCSEDSS